MRSYSAIGVLPPGMPITALLFDPVAPTMPPVVLKPIAILRRRGKRRKERRKRRRERRTRREGRGESRERARNGEQNERSGERRGKMFTNN